MTDYRASRMPSAEGQGRVQKAWDAYAATANNAARPLAMKYATRKVEGLVGFWVTTTQRYLHYLGTSADETGLSRLNQWGRAGGARPAGEHQ